MLGARPKRMCSLPINVAGSIEMSGARRNGFRVRGSAPMSTAIRCRDVALSRRSVNAWSQGWRTELSWRASNTRNPAAGPRICAPIHQEPKRLPYNITNRKNRCKPIWRSQQLPVKVRRLSPKKCGPPRISSPAIEFISRFLRTARLLCV